MRILFLVLGCSKNQVEAETLASLFANKGYEIVDSYQNADCVIIHTCAFISTAREEAEWHIRKVLEYKKTGSCRKVVVTGCWVQYHTEDVEKIFPEVDHFVGTAELHKLEKILSQTDKCLQQKHVSRSGGGYLDLPLGYKRMLPKGEYSAFIRLAEGCNHGCSFCVIPQLRGKYRSRSIKSIVNEVRILSSYGVKEINLISQNTTYYGLDLYNKLMLTRLIEKLENIEGIKWIRLLYTHPMYINSELLKLMNESDKLCKYLDMPVQHVNDRLLKLMRRGMGTKKLLEIIGRIRNTVPEIVLRTTLIAGFPTETRKEFRELSDFVKEIKFNHLGAFEYSDEPSTLSYKLKERVPPLEKTLRVETLFSIQKRVVSDYMKKRLGTISEVLITGLNQKHAVGRSCYEAPEVDGNVIINTLAVKPGDIVKVRYIGYREYDIIAELVKE
ncbi:MAG: 30S ribosomal protein S12 methylthiotransferase RimO [Elusimicrobiota bacterium]